MPLKTNAHENNRQKYNSHTGLNNIHTEVIWIIPLQHLVLLSCSLGVEFQCTSECSALLLFPSTALDRETQTTWLNSHRLLCFSRLFSLSVSLSVHWAGGGWRWRVLSGSDFKSTVLLLLMRSLRGVYRSIFTLLRGWADIFKGGK